MTQLPLVDFLATDTTTPGVWVLQFPAPAPMTSVNQRGHWAADSTLRRTWRDAVYAYAHHAHLPKGLGRVRIDIALQFPAAGRRDTANYHPTIGKPCVDALGPGRRYRSKKSANGWVTELGYGFIADDTPQHLDGPHITFGQPIGRKRGYGRVTITITDLTENALPPH
jgi:hypothetical protein